MRLTETQILREQLYSCTDWMDYQIVLMCLRIARKHNINMVAV